MAVRAVRATPNDKPQDDAPVHRESCRLCERLAPPSSSHSQPTRRAQSPQNDQNRRSRGGSALPFYLSTKHYPPSAHGEGGAARRADHTHFPRIPPNHFPGPLPDGASASFSYCGPPQPPLPGAAPPVPPPHGGLPLVLDRERPAPLAPEFEYAAGPSHQGIGQADQLRTRLAHAETRIASLSAWSNPSAALAQVDARAETTEDRLATIQDGR
ncbi:hypothetical protein FRC09_013536 [Ceratobasidium sp. 395]|nr:hypothetical protein FRC09_013536 [Ceratobasidium sp. 395]